MKTEALATGGDDRGCLRAVLVSLSCTDYVLLTWGKQPRVQKQLTLVLSVAWIKALTPLFKGHMAKHQIPYPLKRWS